MKTKKIEKKFNEFKKNTGAKYFSLKTVKEIKIDNGCNYISKYPLI